jgi:hypothetical protein
MLSRIGLDQMLHGRTLDDGAFGSPAKDGTGGMVNGETSCTWTVVEPAGWITIND